MDHVHRAGSWLVLLLSLMLWWGGRQAGARGLIQFAIRGNGLLCLGQVAVGITLAYAALPPAAQVAHLFLASLLVCHQLLLILMLGHAGRETNPLHEPGSHGWTATGTTP